MDASPDPRVAAVGTSGRRHLLRGTLAVALGLGVAQVSGYLVNLVGARLLGPDGFGAVASLLGVVLVANTVAIAVQIVGARRLSAGRRDALGTQAVGRLARTAAVAVLLVLLLLTPLLTAFLHLAGPAPVLAVALALVPLTLAGGQLAVTQGSQDFPRTGVLYAVLNAGKAAGAIAGIVTTRSVIGSMVGLALGSLAGWALGLVVVRPLARPGPTRWPGAGPEALHVTHFLVAFFCLTSVDVVLARHYLTADLAGQYAVGALLTKIAFFLPQFALVVLFPRMAATRGRGGLPPALAATVGLGLLITLGAVLAAPLAVAVLGGPAYDALAPSLWLFALLGTALAVVQAVIYGRLAAEDRWTVVAVWATVAAVASAITIGPHDAVRSVVVPTLTLVAALAAVGAGVALRHQGVGTEDDMMVTTDLTAAE